GWWHGGGSRYSGFVLAVAGVPASSRSFWGVHLVASRRVEGKCAACQRISRCGPCDRVLADVAHWLGGGTSNAQALGVRRCRGGGGAGWAGVGRDFSGGSSGWGVVFGVHWRARRGEGRGGGVKLQGKGWRSLVVPGPIERHDNKE